MSPQIEPEQIVMPPLDTIGVKALQIAESIKQAELSLITLLQEQAEKEYILEKAQNKIRGTVEGKNQSERESALFFYLDTDDNYRHHKKQLEQVKKAIAERKVDLHYFENLLGAYRLLVRLEYIKASRRVD